MVTIRRTWSVATCTVVATLLAGCSTTTAPAAVTTATSSTATTSSPAGTASAGQRALDAELASLERSYGARIGVTAVDTGTGRTVSYRGGERFAFDSTGKLFSAATLLRDDSDAQLDAVVHYTEADLQSYSPITADHVDTGMSVRALIGAALQDSDNTAANLLFAQARGPQAVQTWLRAHDDRVTNVDRTEPTLNSAVPGDPRDTTTPHQMASDLEHLVLGHWLDDARRGELTETMLGNTTGAPYIRAGVPPTWRVADKTGNGDWGTRNDVAVVYPPDHAPVVIAVYTGRRAADADSADDLIQRTTSDVIGALGLG